MRTRVTVAIVGALAATTVVLALRRVVSRVQGPAEGDISGFLSLPEAERERRPVVVCLGASVVRGRASVDFVHMLRDAHPDVAFVNGGVNSRLAWELLQDLDDVLQCQPTAAIILVGPSDAQAILAPGGGAKIQRQKGLPAPPSVDLYGQSLSGTVQRLQQAGAHVAVCSLPPLGQDLADAANGVVDDLNRVMQVVCESQDATYLPTGEHMQQVLRDAHADTGPAFTGSWTPGLQSLVWHFIGRRSFDQVAERHGLLLSPDGVHLNTAGARIVATLAGAFVADPDASGVRA